jgi:DNA polymerase elongation subunit (family B)
VQKVNKTIKFAQEFNKKINAKLASAFHPAIQMAYEETLFPTYFCAKKYYVGRIHATEYNEKMQIFMRGITIVKKKTSKLCKKLGKEFLHKLLDPYNVASIDEL